MKVQPGHLLLGLLLLAPYATASAQSPALSPIPDVTLNAGVTQMVNIVAIDASGAEISLSASAPSFATLNSPRIGIGQVVTTLSLSPADIDVGTYTAAVTATSGGVVDTEIFEITVNAVGSPSAPMVSSPGLRQVEYGSNLSFMVDVVDPDGGGISSLVASPLPGSATFTPDGTNSAATFSWTPEAADAGEFDVEFLATAVNSLSGSSFTHIRVTGPPPLAIDPIDDITVEDGGFISVPVNSSAPPGNSITLTASLPSFATLNPPGSGTGSVSTTITVMPPNGSAGTYRASVTATSEGDVVTELFDIIVTGDGGPENNPPVLSSPVEVEVAAGSNVSFVVTATDPDGDPVDLFGTSLPPGASFIDNRNNTGTFSWDPAAGDEGIYLASFSGLDNRGGSGAASTQITVTGEPVENLSPTVVAPATEQVAEGATLSFMVTATDPDGDPVALTADQMPFGADFTDQGDDSGVFTWTPGSDQVGVHEIVFTGEDGRGGSGTASTVVTVLDADEPGTCLITGDLDICEGETAELCGPEDALSYSWTGPDGFVASTPCIQASVGGVYTLAVVNPDQNPSSCSVTLSVLACDVSNCPRGLGFWMSQCAQRGNGSTKFTRAEMDAITACIDASSDFFNWGIGFDGFCDVIDPPKPMDIRKQALRMYAVLLANVCAGQLGIVPDRGGIVALDPATRIEGRCVDGVDTIADLIAAAEVRFAELDGMPLNHEVKSVYERFKDCIERVNEGKGIGPTCDEDKDRDDDCKDRRDDDKRDRDRDRDDDKDCDRCDKKDCDHGDKKDRDDDGKDDDKGDEGDDDEGDDGNQDGLGEDPQDAPDRRKSGLSPNVSPNPLNPNTELSFHLSREGRVRVNIYSAQGQLVKALVDGHRGVGEQRVRWDGTDNRNRTVPSGVYFIRIQTPQGEVTPRATVLK